MNLIFRTVIFGVPGKNTASENPMETLLAKPSGPRFHAASGDPHRLSVRTKYIKDRRIIHTKKKRSLRRTPAIRIPVPDESQAISVSESCSVTSTQKGYTLVHAACIGICVNDKGSTVGPGVFEGISHSLMIGRPVILSAVDESPVRPVLPAEVSSRSNVGPMLPPIRALRRAMYIAFLRIDIKSLQVSQ